VNVVSERVRSRAVTRDVYGRPPQRQPGRISRRSLLGLGFTARARADIDYDGVTDRVRAGWERDGHGPLLRAIEPVAEVLVELAGVGPGRRVLDAAAGDGNVTAAALERGAEVDACDIAMADRGRARCPEARWRTADVQALPYEDGAFDAVLSSFGAALAPAARRTARELVRVARPGGVVALTAWVPRGLPGRLDELVEAEAPLPDGVRSPADWGVQAVVRQRLEPLLEPFELRTRTVRLAFADADALFEALLRPAPLDVDQRAAIRPAFDDLLASCNNAPPPPDDAPRPVEIDARYLIALGRRPE
jgi:SAM-dependent methyltransferase